MKRTISNSDDIIDSRDVIARIEELESLFESEEITEGNGAEPQYDDDGKLKVDTTTCDDCGKSWNDALISGSTPAPSARCPYEHIHGELEELKALRALADEADGSPDWHHGETLIRDSYFEDYARELAEDIGSVPKDLSWPACHIDWEAATDALKQDYTRVEFDGVDYWIRG